MRMKAKVFSIVISITMLLLGAIIMGGSNNKYVNDIMSSKGNLVIDITDFSQFDKVLYDINNDGSDEIILLLGKGDKHMLEEAYVAICEGASEKVITSFEVTPLAIGLGNIYDSNGDDLMDISIESHTGGVDGAKTTLFIYKDGKYIANK